jgi:transposase InsO family protein
MSAEHPIAALCAALEVTPAGYHAWMRAQPGERERADAELAGQIAAVHRAHRGRYGAPRIQREWLAHGRSHSRKRIARLMRERGLSAHRPRRYVPRTTDSDHDEPIAPNRIATRPTPTGRDQVWVSDLSYVPTAEGWLYAAVVLDRWSRRHRAEHEPPWQPL